jgi:molybdopterin converting factor small subunit
MESLVGKTKGTKFGQERVNRFMLIKILFFGGTADAIGSRRTEMEINGSDTVGEVVNRLLRRYPQLSDRKLLSAVNEEYTGLDVVLKDGDELALFTPVSGG